MPRSRQLNENGLDADWQASARACRDYVRGQLRIVRSAVQECEALLAAL